MGFLKYVCLNLYRAPTSFNFPAIAEQSSIPETYKDARSACAVYAKAEMLKAASKFPRSLSLLQSQCKTYEIFSCHKDSFEKTSVQEAAYRAYLQVYQPAINYQLVSL